MESGSDCTRQQKALNGSLNSNLVAGLTDYEAAYDGSLCSRSSVRAFGFLGSQKSNSPIKSLNANHLGLSVHNAVYAMGVSHLTVHLSNLEFEKSQKSIKKKRTPAPKPKCRKRSKPETQFKAGQKGLPYLTNPYLNFLRAFRVLYCKEPQGASMVRKAASFWNDLNGKQRALFKPENLNRGISALSILNHLQYWKAQQQNYNSLHNNDGDVDNEDSCCPKRKRKTCAKKKKPKRRSCRPKKKRSCRPKKKRSCRPKRRSCKRKKRSCRPKRRSCRPKKKACRPKPKCRPKRRC